ncbi:mRNA deadenylase subunit [Nucleospora cyclopteri]
MNNKQLIKNVWEHNLHQEIANIRQIIKKYNYVAMDTEFPGVVAKPIGSFKTPSNFAYQQLRCNVDILNLIQLGISLSDGEGNRPEPVHTWQFNFKFNLNLDMYSQESIDLLLMANIDFKEHLERGIELTQFGALLVTSGLVMSKKIQWIGFHCAYDFAYLIKILTGNAMPEKETNFYTYLSILFPSFYDFKYLIRNSEYMKKGLQEISNSLGAIREGTAHQAGSDALLTADVFFKSQESLLNDIQIIEGMNKLYGIEQCMSEK